MKTGNSEKLLFLSSVICMVLFGCKTIDFDQFKENEKEAPPPPRSEYSILAEPGKGAKLIPSEANAEHITVAQQPVSEVKSFLPDDSQNEPPLSVIKGTPAVADDSLPVIGNSRTPKDTDALFKKLFPQHAEGGESEYIKVAINFDAANLGDVIPAFAAPLKMNYLLDPAVTGTITMSLKANMTPREVWTLFEQILQMAGAYCEMENQVVHIRPQAKLPQEKKMLQPDSNIEAHLFPLKHVAAKDIVAQLKPFLSDAATATSLDKQNALLLVENTANMPRLLALVSQLDRRTRAGWQQTVFICRNVSATQMQQELLALLPILGFQVADAKQNAETGEIGIACLERVQALVVSAVTAEALQEVRKWVKALDQTDIGEQERVYLYDVINGKADELVSALSIIFPVESSTMSAENSGGGSGASSSGSKAKTSGGGASSAARGAVAAKTSTASATPPASGVNSENKSTSIYDSPVKVFADAVHNRLLIRTTPRTYAMVRAILDRMDTAPAQILMQILVVEIELSDGNEFGMEFSMSNSSGSSKSIFGTNFESLSPNTNNKPQSGGTFTIFNPKNPDEKFGYIRALASRNNLKVLSSPQIIAKSHSRAKISVGKRVPIITNEITDTQSSVDPNNTSLRRSYQYEDTGIILTVTPQVTKGGMISMALEQIISDAMENTMRGIESPIIKEDVLETELAIRDGRTLIMGGLIKEKHNEVITSLPWIIDVPFLRTFFSNMNKSRERTEILVLITASIIREENDLGEMLRRYRQAVQEIEKFEHAQYKQEKTVPNASPAPELPEKKP